MEHTYDLKFIVGMDESTQWFDLPYSGKYYFRGVKAVKANKTGKEKLQYTVVLAAMADGTKLPGMVIFENIKHISMGKFPKDVVVNDQ